MSWMGPDVSLVPGRSDGLPRTDVSTVANVLNYHNSSGWKACKATVVIPVNGAVACGIGAINDENKSSVFP